MSQPAKNNKPGRTGRPLIYIVDDEPLLLDLAEATLESTYHIKKFNDPQQALSAFIKDRRRPKMLISDYAMGRMNGIELITRCKEAQPELKTMLLSGTAGAEIVLNAPVRVDRFLGKPYQPSTLLETVQDLLAA